MSSGNSGFWAKLKKPIIVLAPMADVTDGAFRRVIAKYSRMGESHGGPDAMWTEFVSADGLVLAPEKGKKKLLADFIYTEAERPIVAQIFGGKPENIFKASKLVASMGFDGLDINMGCPDRTIEKQCAGAALMKNPALAREIIRSAKAGIESAGKNIPVSLKTRIGYNKPELATWLPELLAEEPAAITIHARTRKEMSSVPARWETVAEAVAIRDLLKSKTLILGNGDVLDVSDARKKVAESGADGAMLGRAIFGNPWLFDESRKKEEVSLAEKLRVLAEHTELFEELFKGVKNFAMMKKHYKAYVQGFEGAAELRAKLMETETAKEVREIVEEFLTK